MTETNFLGDEIPKENAHYTCVTRITIYFVAKIEKKYPQVYLENANIKIKKIKMPKFIDTVLESELVLVLNNLLFVDCVLNNV